MNPLTYWLNWRARKRAAKALRAAERERLALMQQRDARRSRHARSSPQSYLLVIATNRSLAASIEGRR